MSPATLNEQIRSMAHESLTISQLGWVATYRTNRINLALSLLMIVRACHDAKYIHNDISLSNVLFHFDEEKANTVYIGLCDWGLSVELWSWYHQSTITSQWKKY